LIASLLASYELVRRSGLLDTTVGRRVFETCYDLYKRNIEARNISHARRYLAPGDLVIDVGANIGVLTELFASWVGFSGRVIAIEPEPKNLAALRHRMARRNLGSVVEVVSAAAGDRAGKVLLRIEPDHPGDHHVVANGDENPNVVSVDCLTLDEIVEKHQGSVPRLIKIDVQGAEAMVLRGARKTLGEHRPVLVIEIDRQSLARGGSSEREVFQFLDGLDYVACDLKSGQVLQEAPELGTADYADILFLARSR
jgi:FkbM family methyltransferase